MSILAQIAPPVAPDFADVDLDPIAPDDRRWWTEQTRDDADDAPDFDFDPTDDDLAEMMTRARIGDGFAVL